MSNRLTNKSSHQLQFNQNTNSILPQIVNSFSSNKIKNQMRNSNQIFITSGTVSSNTFLLDRSKCPVNSSSNKFQFLGYLPKKNGKKTTKIGQQIKFLEGNSQLWESDKQSSAGISFMTKQGHFFADKQPCQPSNTQFQFKQLNELGLQSGIEVNMNGNAMDILPKNLGIQSNYEQDSSYIAQHESADHKYNYNHDQQSTLIKNRQPTHLSVVTPADIFELQISLNYSSLESCRICNLLISKSQILGEQLCRVCYMLDKTRLLSLKNNKLRHQIKRSQSTQINREHKTTKTNTIQDRLRPGYGQVRQQKLSDHSSQKQLRNGHQRAKTVGKQRHKHNINPYQINMNTVGKCSNIQCSKDNGTLVKYNDKAYCIQCYYQIRR